MSRSRASFMLVVVTALWGLSFTWTRSWHLAARDAPVGELLSALTLISLRMPLALLLLGLWQPRVVFRPTCREHAGGTRWDLLRRVRPADLGPGLHTAVAVGVLHLSLQRLGAALAYVCFRERVAPLTLAGLVLALIGCGVLADGWRLGPGEWLTLVASVLFAGQLLVLDRLGKAMEPSHLTAGFIAATSLLALAGGVTGALIGPGLGVWMEWTGEMLGRSEVVRGVVCQALFATVLSFHWMNECQPRVPPANAALIYLLEPVFTSIFSVILGMESLTYPLVAGGVLILAGNGLAALPVLLTWPRESAALSRTDS